MNKIINEILNASVPTRLVVGQLEQIQNLVELAIRSNFCEQKNNSDSTDSIVSIQDCFCLECRRIKNHQHPCMVWISPEKNYSVDDVEIIFDRTKFALDIGQTFFFVLDQASSLNTATANKLLKVLEEPPAGYKFILLAENISTLPATVISRSHIIKTTGENEQTPHHAFLKYFTAPENLPDPIAFDQELKKTGLSEQECVELCYDLMEYFVNKQTISDSKYFRNGLDILQKRLHKPPCPGSSNMFLKLLYLDFCQIK
ncbi:MAG: hypothetical protein WCS92_05945 [Candidatus Babeliales bacterium]|jgi:DNA polymerase-3 subunit delta'|nr:MAG: polymerase III, delta prime subunit protein [candidate division TM6 bacterium GW2011_GWF2_36_6]